MESSGLRILNIFTSLITLSHYQPLKRIVLVGLTLTTTASKKRRETLYKLKKYFIFVAML